MKRIIIEFLIGLPVVVLLFALLEFLYCTFITHTAFAFNFKGCAVAIGVWAVVEAVTFFKRKSQ